MDVMELQNMLSTALRGAPRQRAYDYPPLDDQNHASLKAGFEAMKASGMDRARPDIMEGLYDANAQVDAPLNRTPQPEPLAAQNRASIDAGLQGIHASGLEGTEGGADLMDRLYGARDQVVTPLDLQKLQVAALQRRYGAPPAPQGVSASMGPVAMVDRTPMEPDVSASMGPVAMLSRTPEQGSDGTAPLSAGLQAMRAALPPDADPELLKQLQSGRAGR